MTSGLCTVKLHVDAKPALAAIDALTELAKRNPALVHDLVAADLPLLQGGQVDPDDFHVPKGDVVMRIEPTERVRLFLEAHGGSAA